MMNSLLCLLFIFTVSSSLFQALCKGSSGNGTYNVLNFGAIGDGSTDDTQAFEDAWNATCESRVGSPATMHIPSGSTFLLQPIVFTGPCNSDVNVMESRFIVYRLSLMALDPGTSEFIEMAGTADIAGTLIAPSDPSQWKCKDNECSQWITFHDLNNLSISGAGTINGQGTKWWDCNKDCGTKPYGFSIVHSNNVCISDLTFMDSPQKHIGFESSTCIHATNLTITAPENSPNTDGIHIQHSQHVFINECLIGTGDDCISIGDGSAYLNISSITCGPGHGISVGSLGFNGANETVEHVYVSDVVFRGTENGVRIKTWQIINGLDFIAAINDSDHISAEIKFELLIVRSTAQMPHYNPGGKGYATDIVFERITNFDSKRPIVIDQFYCDDHLTCTNQTSAVAISNVRYNGIQGTSQGDIAIKFACTETVPCTDIYMNDVDLSSDDTNKTMSSCQNVQGTQHEVVPNVPCLTNK